MSASGIDRTRPGTIDQSETRKPMTMLTPAPARQQSLRSFNRNDFIQKTSFMSPSLQNISFEPLIYLSICSYYSIQQQVQIPKQLVYLFMISSFEQNPLSLVCRVMPVSEYSDQSLFSFVSLTPRLDKATLLLPRVSSVLRGEDLDTLPLSSCHQENINACLNMCRYLRLMMQIYDAV